MPAGAVEFRWKAVPYAAEYELTLMSPSFGEGRIVADTVLRVDTLGSRSYLVVGWNWAVENTSGGSRPSTRGTRRTRRCGLSRCSPSELRVTDRSRQDGSDFCRLSDLPERWKT